MRDSTSDTLISDLIEADDLLAAGRILKDIDAFLSESRTGRAAFCKKLSRELLDRVIPFATWLILNDTGYIIYRPALSIPIYMWMHGLVGIGTVRDTAPRIKKLVEYIDTSFIEPSGNYLTEERANHVLQVLQAKLPYFEIVSRREPLRIFLLDNTHRHYNSECCTGTVSSQIFVFLYHMKDNNLSPEYVFLHELGHALQISLTGSINVVPDEFLSFNQTVGVQLKQGSPEAPEVFADLFAIAVMRGTELYSHDPFDFPDVFKGSIEHLFIQLFQEYKV